MSHPEPGIQHKAQQILHDQLCLYRDHGGPYLLSLAECMASYHAAATALTDYLYSVLTASREE